MTLFDVVECSVSCDGCHHVSGQCMMCADGYYGQQCQGQLYLICYHLTYIQHYVWFAVCKYYSLFLEFVLMFVFSNCVMTSIFTACSQSCVDVCDKVTGDCDCLPGYYGDTCTKGMCHSPTNSIALIVIFISSFCPHNLNCCIMLYCNRVSFTNT